MLCMYMYSVVVLYVDTLTVYTSCVVTVYMEAQ